MNEALQRTAMLLGEENVKKLACKHVAVVGLGGVGGHCAEALCRAGIGMLTLIDSEDFDLTNCNRQLFATRDTIGQKKVFAARNRLLSIFPDCRIRAIAGRYPEDVPPEALEEVDLVIDAIDSLSAKLDLIENMTRQNVPVLSSMGTGNKLDPTRFRVSDISKTSVCPLAKAVRQACRKRGIKKLTVVWSDETPIKPAIGDEPSRVPGSVSFVPGVAGMILAGEAVKKLLAL